jgi:phage replication O-like protein O
MTKGDRENGVASLDDGFTMIPNLLLEALTKVKLSDVQKTICFYILRRTYGWNCIYDVITIDELAEACTASQRHVRRLMNDLVKKNIVRRKSSSSGNIMEYAIVTDISAWDPKCIDLLGLLKSYDQGLYTNHTNRRLRDAPAKQPVASDPEPYSYAKTLNGILTKTIYFCESQPYQLSELLLEKIRAYKPDYKTPNLQRWAEQMEAILTIDKRPLDEVRAVIEFAVSDNFRQNKTPNVIKLRHQYDEINERRLISVTAAAAAPAVTDVQKYAKPEPKPKKKSKFEPFYDG